ncbi:histidine protein methyltransferase 1 homolog [Numida meleagris]|uniref:histidine protein methyltransferase 1 homolog n=1 Tax=Numida meleagris TaxID=8996 RepID=UPI000B3DC199|nr:histidine protein methyltransferase 1 homolog [Numida meleagris]
MDFRFNFFPDEDETKEPSAHDETEPKHEHQDKRLPEEKVCIKAAKEHYIPADVSKVLENKVLEKVSGLYYVNMSVVELTCQDGTHGEDIVSKSISSHSDLIPGVYEGGLKIWECTYDLMDFLSEAEIQFANKTVLDLGCGAGLLGIVALKGNAEKVHFQDYNSTVIEEITMPNVVANCINDGSEADSEDDRTDLKPPSKRHKKSVSLPDKLSQCRFFSGGWSEVSQLLLSSSKPCSKYDLILTSETIYNPDYYGALHDTLAQLLAKDGRVYLASKVHYFGVGGGTYLFEQFIEERKVFRSSIVKEVEEGLKRFILEITFKDST